MNYSFQKIYTLIAQTPIIHFQHDQAGATLRATEVKPKLDKYLLKCAEGEIDKETIQSWYIKDDSDKDGHKSLQYKMKILQKEQPKDSDITLKDCKFYFGNQGDADKKELVFNNCELQITCFITELLEFIHKHIFDFFVLHNFGTRQTKGFGGFTVQYENENGHIQEQSNVEIEKVFQNSNQPYFYADMSREDQASVKNRMNHALTVYSVMKNGLNMTRYDEKTGRYGFAKSYIKGYTMRPWLDGQYGKGNVGSDKAFIKSRVFRPSKDDTMDMKDRDYAEHTFIRALLGLAEHYEFRDRYRNNGLTSKIKDGKNIINYNPVGITVISCPKNADGTPNINPNASEDDIKKSMEIQRLASPVTIKIFKHRIYFLFNDSYKQILNKTFLFRPFRKVNKDAVHASISECLRNGYYLSTPKNFDMEAFLDGFISYYNGAKQYDPNSVRNKLNGFGYPYRNSTNLILQKGRKSNGTSGKNGK